MNSLVRELVNLGLSEKEAAVYLALLEISPASVQDVAQTAGVNRATAYLLVDSLTKRGVVSRTTKGKKELCVAEPPERLITLLRLQRQELEEKERELRAALPLFEAIHNSKREKPQIRYFEGRDGLRAARELFLTVEGEYIQIVPLDDAESVTELLAERTDHYRQLHADRIPLRSLIVMEEPDTKRLLSVPHAEMRVISATEFPIHAEVTVRGNLIIFFSFKPLLSVVVANDQFADTLRALFVLAWKAAADCPRVTTQ